MGSHTASQPAGQFRIVRRPAHDDAARWHPSTSEVLIRVEWAGLPLRTVRLADGESFELATSPRDASSIGWFAMLVATISGLYLCAGIAASSHGMALVAVGLLFIAALIWQFRRSRGDPRRLVLPDGSLARRDRWELVRVRRGRTMVFAPIGAQAFDVNGVERSGESGVILGDGHHVRVRIAGLIVRVDVVPGVVALPRGRPFRELAMASIPIGVLVAPALLLALPGPGNLSRGAAPPDRDFLADLVHVSVVRPTTPLPRGAFRWKEPSRFGDPARVWGNEGFAAGYGGEGLIGAGYRGLAPQFLPGLWRADIWSGSQAGAERAFGGFGGGYLGFGSGSRLAGCGLAGNERSRVSVRVDAVSTAGALDARRVRGALTEIAPAMAHCLAHDEFEPWRSRRSAFLVRLWIDRAGHVAAHEIPAASDHAWATGCARCVLDTVPLPALRAGRATVRFAVQNR